MTPSEARAFYADQLSQFGEMITLRRPATMAEITVRARVTEYKPEELGGGINQGDRRVIVLASDVTFDPPLRVGDKVVLRGNRVLNISVIDDNTRRIAGELIAYDIAARGS
jgi:hypothetical protein